MVSQTHTSATRGARQVSDKSRAAESYCDACTSDASQTLAQWLEYRLSGPRVRVPSSSFSLSILSPFRL
ncbi:hypothetical protein TSAR_008350 [Trichomalopsis sarcophagae]|uniref:Uncharacterized protein n=1 Tax=Trichomalopsis sarcophagae TaxID=543379 RepID=A0A232EZH1_9HYME|nr:hypothetical protein TSAR_008350 [Trichomalopsis sarcophagae]